MICEEAAASNNERRIREAQSEIEKYKSLKELELKLEKILSKNKTYVKSVAIRKQLQELTGGRLWEINVGDCPYCKRNRLVKLGKHASDCVDFIEFCEACNYFKTCGGRL